MAPHTVLCYTGSEFKIEPGQGGTIMTVKARASFRAPLVVLLLLGASSVARADFFTGVGIAVGLDKMADAVKEAIDNSVGGGQILEIQAGGQLLAAIAQAKSVFDQERNLTLADFHGSEQTTLSSLQTTAEAFIEHSFTDAKTITRQAQGIVHDLPFSKNFPQVWRYSPTYVAPTVSATGPGHAHLELEGDFYDVLRADYDATLTIGQANFEAAGKTSQMLAFDVPLDKFTASASASTINYVKVVIPYRDNFLGVVPRKRESTLLLPIIFLPPAPGTVTVSITATAPTILKQSKTSPEQIQESGDDDIKCGGQHADLAIHTDWPDSGWRVVPSSVTWKVNWSQGHEGHEGHDNDFWLERNCSSATAACLCVSTEHHRAGTSGKVHFNINYTEEKDSTVANTTSQAYKMGWGDSRVIEVPAGATWAGDYTRFDGKQVQFTGPHQDAYLRVSQIGSTLTLQTAPYEVVDDAKVAAAVSKAGVQQ